MVVVLRSRKGTGFDYWLGKGGDAAFAAKARLEVSGILDGGEYEEALRRGIFRARGRLSALPLLFSFQPPHHSERVATFAGADESPLFQRFDRSEEHTS